MQEEFFKGDGACFIRKPIGYLGSRFLFCQKQLFLIKWGDFRKFPNKVG